MEFKTIHKQRRPEELFEVVQLQMVFAPFFRIHIVINELTKTGICWHWNGTEWTQVHQIFPFAFEGGATVESVRRELLAVSANVVTGCAPPKED